MAFNGLFSSTLRICTSAKPLRTPKKSTPKSFVSVSNKTSSIKKTSIIRKTHDLIAIKSFLNPKSGLQARYYTVSRQLKTDSNAASEGFHENHFENNLPEYHRVANQTIEELLEKCEELESLNIPGFDVFDKDGVFELNLGPHGIYVINKQGPNRQMWWSSPISGPKRYNYDVKTEAWRNTRDGHFMYDLLNQELSSILKIDFDMYTIAQKPKL